MSLEKQGMVFIIRPSPDGKAKYLWLHPEFVQLSDIDCTGMDDKQFEEAVINDNRQRNIRTSG